MNINDCDPDPCLNEAVCVDRVNDYYCNCTSDWMGKTCNQVRVQSSETYLEGFA